MNKTAKIILVIAALAIVAFIAYRASRGHFSKTTPSAANVNWTSYDSKPNGYAIDQPDGFTSIASPDGKVVSFRNGAITKDKKFASVSVQQIDNPDGLSLGAWFDKAREDGFLPAYATSTKITRDTQVGGKDVIIVQPATLGSSTYFFVGGPKTIVAIHEILSEDYMDRFISSYKAQ